MLKYMRPPRPANIRIGSSICSMVLLVSALVVAPVQSFPRTQGRCGAFTVVRAVNEVRRPVVPFACGWRGMSDE
jgi:hypothetical protein